MNLYLKQVCLHEPYLVHLNDNMNEFNFVSVHVCIQVFCFFYNCHGKVRYFSLIT